MADSAQDRTLPASERKITKAREDGQVARSRDLGHFGAFLVAGLGLSALAPKAIEYASRLVAQGLRFDVSTVASPEAMLTRLGEHGWKFALAVVPLGLVMALVALASGVAAGGWNFTWKALQPKWSHLDPLSGVRRVFSTQQLGTMLKACLLALVLGLIGVLYLKTNLARFAGTLSMPLQTGLGHAGAAVWGGVLLLLLAMGVFALVDVPLQRFMWLKQLRMSHEEAKKEHKDAEGNAEVKSKIKVRMREMANRRMLAQVPKADLVVMNPTHFAVALKYDEHTMAAPRVLAKGADLMAFRIRDAATAAKVPVLEAPPLARALYAHAEVDREIPAALFSAVAQVLAWVYQLRASMAGRGLPPGNLPELAVPPELDPAAKAKDAEE